MEQHAAEHAPTIAGLLWPTVNFTIFTYLLVRALAGPLREFFRERTGRLREELAVGARARAEAESVRAQLAKDLADLPALRERLKGDMRETAERQRDQLLVQAKQAAERIRNDARLLAEQEIANARRTLRDETVSAALREATALVRGALQPQDHERFVRDFVGSAGAAS